MLAWRGLMLLCILSLSLVGCDNPEGGSFTDQPLADEPTILDAALAINVSEGRPDGISDLFYTNTERIYLWIYWINLSGTHTVEVQWFSPSADIDEPTVRSTESVVTSSGRAITAFFLEQPPAGFETGEWFVEIYLDGFFERSYLFQVN